MEKMRHAEELVREFLVFRGFTNTLESYETELRTDIGKGFEVNKILDLIFSVYVPKFHADKLVALLGFFKHYLSSPSDTLLVSTLSKLEASILRFYVVHAVQCNRNDKVVEFFALYGSELLQRSQDWTLWFAIPYKKNPHLDPEFRAFFSKEWYQALHLSSRNFFSEVFSATRLPALLKVSSEMNATNILKRDIVHLNLKLSQLQALLDEKEAQLRQFRSMEGSIGSSSNLREESTRTVKNSLDVFPTSISQVGQIEVSQDLAVGELGNVHSELIGSTSGDDDSASLSNDCLRNGGADNASLKENDGDEDFAEVKVEHQETFLGHTSPISRCRFSASGNNIASASLDGTVRIWTYDTSTPVSRNATIYCGTEILSLDWECKSDRLLLIGTSDGCIKAWNVDAKRVVCDLSTTESFPSVLDIKCSPVEPIFVSAAASGGAGSKYVGNLGFASLHLSFSVSEASSSSESPMASLLNIVSVPPRISPPSHTRTLSLQARPVLPPFSLSFSRRRLSIRATETDTNEVKSQPPSTAPSKAGSSFNQLLGIKGAAQETNKWKIRLQLTKPVTWPPLVWGVVCGAAASGNFHWNFEDVAKSIVCMMMSGPFLTGYTQTLNDWYDREIDAINEPYRPIPSGAISENEVITQIWVLLLGGISLAGILDIWAGHDFPIVFYLSVGGALLSYIYSAPPLKLKQNGWIGNFALGASYISLPWWAGQALFGTLTPDIIVLTLLYSIAGLGIAIVNDFKSIEGDRALGLQSLPVAFGAETAKWICVGAIDITQLSVAGYLLGADKPLYALALLALIIPQVIFQFKYFLKDPVKYDVKYQASAQPFLVLGLLVTALATSH